jgi:hypothetical protein
VETCYGAERKGGGEVAEEWIGGEALLCIWQAWRIGMREFNRLTTLRKSGDVSGETLLNKNGPLAQLVRAWC